MKVYFKVINNTPRLWFENQADIPDGCEEYEIKNINDYKVEKVNGIYKFIIKTEKDIIKEKTNQIKIDIINKIKQLENKKFDKYSQLEKMGWDIKYKEALDCIKETVDDEDYLKNNYPLLFVEVKIYNNFINLDELKKLSNRIIKKVEEFKTITSIIAGIRQIIENGNDEEIINKKDEIINILDNL